MRGLFGRMAAPMVTRSSVTDDRLFFGEGYGATSATGIPITQTTAMQVSAVMACVRILSNDVSKMTPALFKMREDGGRDLEEKHFLVDLLRRPNSWQTWPEFCRQMVASFALRGNAWAVILGGRIGRGIPTSLWPVHPDRVQLWEAPDGHLFWLVTRLGLFETAVLREMPLMIPYDEMFHLKDVSTNGVLGISPIATAREAIALALGQEQQYARLIGNGARPSGLLTTDQKLSTETAARLAETWKQLHGGSYNNGKTAVLEAGLKWQALSLSMADMEFLAARKFQIEEIARLFRVPLHMIAHLDRATNNNITQQSQDYTNQTLTDHTSVWEARLDFQFRLHEHGLKVDFDETVVLKGDLPARFNAHRIGILTGFESVNEARIAEGRNPVEDGDTLMRPLNMAPLGSDMTGQGADGGGRPPADEPKV